MTDSYEHLQRKLQQQYQQSKQANPLPDKAKKRIIQFAAARQEKQYGWWRNTQLVLGCGFLAVLGYLMMQPVMVPSYQIIVSHDGSFKEIQQHSLTLRSVPAVVAQFTTDENQLRYQQLQAAQQNTAQFYSQKGILHKEQQQWQIKVCDELLVNIDQALLNQLSLYDSSINQLPQHRWVELTRGAQGQILAIRSADSALQCPHS